MQSKKVTRYYSECGKGFWKKTPALDHEHNCKCWTNPKNKTCKTCKYGEQIPYEDDTGDGGYWACNHDEKQDEHTGAPEGITYISVKCGWHFNKSDKVGG